MAIGLTPHQKQTLDFLKSYQAEHGGVSPTFAEILEHLGAKSKSRVSEILIALEERGHIRRLANKPRAIEIVSERSPVSLPPHIDARLRSYCAKHGERPADIIADAVDLHLDELERDSAHAHGDCVTGSEASQ